MRGVTRRRAATVGLVAVILGTIGIWNQRRTLAEGAIDNELARRGVQARFRVANIGLRWERLEDIIIGDPRNPDLTADWAEVRVAATLNGITATAIRAGGVRMHGRLIDGKISFGEIDELLPVSTGAPFTLPNLSVDLTDARIALATPYGKIGARLNGRGNLSNGFRGKLAAIAPTLTLPGCRANRATLYLDVAISDRKPVVKGPARAVELYCGTTRLNEPALGLNVALSEALDHWQGSTAIGVKKMSIGSENLQALSGRLTFAGSAEDTKGTAQIEAASSAHSFGQMSGLSLVGKFGLNGSGVDGRGTVKAARLSLDRRYIAQVRSLAGSASGTPIGPLLRKLSDAGTGAAQNLSVSADVAARVAGSRASAIITTADLMTPQGARLHIGGGQGVGFGASGLFANSQATLKGGGFPTISANFRRGADGTTTATANVAPYEAGTARLALSPVHLVVTPNGAARIVTTASLDGPLGDGHVSGLQAPLALTINGSDIALNPGCTTAAFRALSVSGLQLNPTTVRLCATSGALFKLAGGRIDGGATITSPRLTGRLGSTPVAIEAGRANVAFANSRFALSHVGVKIGGADRLTLLDLGTLEGTIVGGAVTGKFADLSGKIGNVPLLIDSGVGSWTLDRGILALTGAARVSDEAKTVRFNTLAAEDVKLRLVGGKIMMTGMLREPKSRISVSAVAIEHDLGSGNGHAALDVAGLNFGTALQPDTLTPLTLGVVANVAGSIEGKGRIDWSSAGVTSSGRFASKGLDFAAAFGPVTGVAGEIVFTDLLGLVTAPGQTVSIATVNPGIPVPDGRVTYHLAPDQRIVVEGGRWPFAGGALILDPTTLDMGVTKERRLTFRVEGLDAAKFIQQLEFENLAATGLFDGAMPMIFDDKGGRIVGGKIVARPGGGTLSYVGDVSNAKLNVFAKLAFDALKAMRYNNLAIGMDGALDGEIVSTVNFRGVNQAPTTQKRGYFARQFSNLPFIFNITIRAPFRGLLNTARTFQDPSALLSGLPREAPVSGPTLPNKPPAIQPTESGKRP
ncbi:MAG: hypothetical protein JWO15_1634 [Sphingomonadales bacterium]|nr:hypothetical protein [Sphingomonadales bacterium]